MCGLKISVYGMGNFGFALLTHLNRRQAAGSDFSLHGYDNNKRLIAHLRAKRMHPLHHRNVRISTSVIFNNNSKELMADTDILVLAVTSAAIKQVISDLKLHVNRELILVNTAKALDVETGLTFSVIISECLKDMGHPISIAMFAGGTIASDLVNHEPLGVDIASEDRRTLKILKGIFTMDNLRVYTTTDIRGVEYAAALKNVVSILAGIVSGLGFSYGSQTHMISRAAGEVKNLVVGKLGGKEKTFSIESQCWGNDMWMSCTGGTRNREFGILLGKGYKSSEAAAEMQERNKTVEGINTVKAIKGLIEGSESDFPLLQAVSEIVLGCKDPRMTITRLMKSI
jgi:glycerol-3-phosphate dehydrogenase (NAD(P)+)